MYRIVRYPENQGYGVHQVLYEEGKVVSVSNKPITIGCCYNCGPPGILKIVDYGIHATALPILDWVEGWPAHELGDHL